MIFYIVIPAYNEASHIAKTLKSLCEQTLLPTKIVVVDDNSTDETAAIVSQFASEYKFISLVKTTQEGTHQPGSKVINAFNEGLPSLNEDYNVICKFDADLIFPEDYLEKISELFQNNSNCGLAGGFCYVEKNEKWVIENLTNRDHIRGALKAYRKECFQQINGLKNTMGWDTVDELLARYHGWEVSTDESLHVKHLKPTGEAYSKTSRFKQGEAFYKLRYGFWLTTIATAKLSWRKKSTSFFANTMKGFFAAKQKKLPFMVNEKEGKFIREFRWKNIRQKLGIK